MKEMTTTKATYRDYKISVLSDRTEEGRVYCCTNSLGGPVKEDKWFPTQGEAIANERHEIDRRLGFEPQIREVRDFRRGR